MHHGQGFDAQAVERQCVVEHIGSEGGHAASRIAGPTKSIVRGALESRQGFRGAIDGDTLVLLLAV